MKLEIFGRDVEITDAMHTHAERRVGFAFDRVADRIQRVVVRMQGTRDPRGQQAQHCQVRVELAGGGSLVMQEVDACGYTAVDRTVGRMKRVLKKQLARRRDRPRMRTVDGVLGD